MALGVDYSSSGPRLDDRARAELRARAEEIVRCYLGEPNRRLATLTTPRRSTPLKCWRLKSTASSIQRKCNSDQLERGAGVELGDVRFAPKAAELLRGSEMSRRANNGLMHCSKGSSYSITSSAPTRRYGGIVRPSALAVFILMAKSRCVGPWNGNSPACPPFRMRST
jgi:hypothetical protein